MEALFGTAEARPLQAPMPKDAALAREISRGSRRAAAGAGPGGRLHRGDGLRTGRLSDAAAPTSQGTAGAARRAGFRPPFRGGHVPDLVGEAGQTKPGGGGAAYRRAAFLLPDAIPEEIFTEGAAEFGPVLQAAASDPIKWDEAIAAAFKFSLIERNPGKLLAVHRMVQAVAKSRMSAEERAAVGGAGGAGGECGVPVR